jgi:hypothetical protein
MLVNIPYLTDIYKSLPDGKPKLLVKDLISETQIDTDYIIEVSKYINDKGKIDPRYSKITLDSGSLISTIPYEEMCELRKNQNRFIIKGFKKEEDERKSKVSEPKRTRTKDRTGTNSSRNGSKTRKVTSK